MYAIRSYYADSTLYYEGTQPVRLEEDTNFDGSTDIWTRYANGAVTVVEADKNFDGRVDVRAEFAPDGEKVREQQDSTGDGKLDADLGDVDRTDSYLSKATKLAEQMGVITSYSIHYTKLYDPAVNVP